MVTGLVLAGGSSLRMRSDKPFIKAGGKLLIEYVLETLNEISSEIVVSVSRGNAQRFREVLGKGAIIVEDENEGVGPLEGLRVGFKNASQDVVAVAPADVPFVTAEFYRTMIGLSEGYDGAVPYLSGNFEPLLGIYSRESMLAAIEDVMREGGRRPVLTYTKLNIRKVTEEDLHNIVDLDVLLNVNTPEDLRRLENML
jgi:molybdopterin-guanine dinucleotide biosynthesis protein A